MPEVAELPSSQAGRFVLDLSEVGLGDVALVGGKTAAIGELHRALVPRGVRVPNGFAITSSAFRAVIAAAGIEPRLRELMSGASSADVTGLARRAAEARALVQAAPLPSTLIAEIGAAHARLCGGRGDRCALAVRSSATAEDLPQASFAGQHESYLNIVGRDALLAAIRRCFASLFTDRAIQYRINNGFDHFAIALSVVVMQMVRSDLAASGVAFSLDTETGFRDVVMITGTWGLGEALVQGLVDPDEYHVFKPTLRAGHRCVLRRSLGRKATKLVYAASGEVQSIKSVEVPAADRERFCLDDTEVVELADMVLRIEEHFVAASGRSAGMDIEWAKDGPDGPIYILQARPETVQSRRAPAAVERFQLEHPPRPLLTGHAVGTRIASGKARVIRAAEDFATVQDGDVLVAETTSPDWGTVMKRAAAIVTGTGGRTCHAAIVAREVGIPAVVGVGEALGRIADGAAITVSCAGGRVGQVYAGAVPFSVERVDLSRLPHPRTRIMVNVGDPDAAFALSQLPSDGVGLARMEFIITQAIRVHPLALLHPERVADPAERDEIAKLVRNDPAPAEFFVRRLAEGVATIAAAFHPRPVILRLSDFKTNEYAHLLGGRAFEPEEENPMLGFRGAGRYVHPAYAEGFALECAAVRRARDHMGLRNLQLMVPFCRSVSEAERVVEALAAHGLQRGVDGLELYVMCEIPNNVIQAAEFARHFDGFSIGSNDLTQLVLGVDRDSALVADAFNERDPGVMDFIRTAIERVHAAGRTIGICGQAPSDYPEFAEFLVRCGIDSLSLNPDSLITVTQRVYALEQRMAACAPDAI
ncbi:MAG: phosphoenolpyruvate synthase [Gammaproteobacteria bacterium]|nr:phosphoenolpyruvate synthase [Gammaproteobacteria bacterium]